MGSMIQNEIASIKDASIKAAKDKEEWKQPEWDSLPMMEIKASTCWGGKEMDKSDYYRN